MKHIALAAAALAAVASSYSSAAFQTFYGIDATSTTTGSLRPNSDAARANWANAFAAGAPGSTVYETLDYESNVVGTGRNGTIGVGTMGTTLTSANVSATAGGVATGTSGILGFNITPTGTKFFQLYPTTPAGTHTVTWAFDQPVNSWGSYILGLGTANGALNIDFVDGTSQTIPVVGSTQGGSVFFGFTEASSPVASVTARLERPAGGSLDIHGYDQTSYGLIVVPEPTALLAGAAAAGLLALRRRK